MRGTPQKAPMMSDEEQRAIHALWQEKSSRLEELRVDFEARKAQDPKARRTFEQDKLESSLALINNKLAAAFQADLDTEIDNSVKDVLTKAE